MFHSFFLQANFPELMKNLELKVQLSEDVFGDLEEKLQPYYVETLLQTDTYFLTNQGRLKLREEDGKAAYVVSYQRPNCKEAKESKYLFYPVDDVELFLAVFSGVLCKQLQIKKQRALYFPKPYIRLSLDQVEELGNFLEIEIVLSEDCPLREAEIEMQELQESLELKKYPQVDCGYRELLQKSRFEQTVVQRDLNYYKNQNKVFWVVADDLPLGNFKRYDVIPCLFVEKFDDGSLGIIQLDPTIVEDHYQYTAWRKLIGQEHGFRAEVLLIDTVYSKLYTLKGEEVIFDSLSRSSRFIDKSYLARFSTR